MASKGRQPVAEELVSPWRAAKPRRPLRDIPAPDTPEPPQSNSPPNSCNKESTRLGSGVKGSPGGLDLSQGASPGFPHSQDMKQGSRSSMSKTKSITKQGKSFTKLRPRVIARKEDSGSDGEESEGSDPDQPAARCQYVGNSSSRLHRTSDTLHLSSGSPNTSTSSAPATPRKEGGWGAAPWLLLVAVALVLAVMLAPRAPAPGPGEPATAAHWKQMREVVRGEVRALKSVFPNQTSPSFWAHVSAAVKAPMHQLPDYPGVLLLLSSPAARPTAHCLARRLVELASRVLSRPGLVPPPLASLTVDCSTLPPAPLVAKQELTALLHSSLATGGAAAVLGLATLHAQAAITLHAFTDNSNAPYKQAVLVATLEVEEQQQVPPADCRLEVRAESALAQAWATELGPDKLAALLSRLVVTVAEVQEESSAAAACSGLYGRQSPN